MYRSDDESSENRSSRWIRSFHPKPEALANLVCMPHAGGAASFYFSLSEKLSPDFGVLAVQYPGRQDRRLEGRIDSIREMADEITKNLEMWSERPIALFGHSMGALIAYEVACRLEDAQNPPISLFVSGRRAPSRSGDDSLHALGDAEIIEEIRNLGGTDMSLFEDPEVRSTIMPAIRADYHAVATYRYEMRPQLSVPIHAYVGTDDPRATPDEAADWAMHTTGEFRLLEYPGNHFFLLDEGCEMVDDIRNSVLAKVGGYEYPGISLG